MKIYLWKIRSHLKFSWCNVAQSFRIVATLSQSDKEEAYIADWSIITWTKISNIYIGVNIKDPDLTNKIVERINEYYHCVQCKYGVTKPNMEATAHTVACLRNSQTSDSSRFCNRWWNLDSSILTSFILIFYFRRKIFWYTFTKLDQSLRWRTFAKPMEWIMKRIIMPK